MKIPKVNIFKRDSKQSFITCIVEFEAHTRALDINQEKWRDILRSCTESIAFTFIATKIVEGETITYNTLKIEMKRRFFGGDYRRTLQHKLSELIFRKGINVSTFIEELTKNNREVFEIEDPETIISIASNLEEDMHQYAKVFQLTGNKSLENLLELIVTKTQGNIFKPKSEVTNIAYGSLPIATGESDDRID